MNTPVLGIDWHAGDQPDRRAVVFAPARDTSLEPRSLTFGELDARSSRLAGWFRRSGLDPGDVVAICCRNDPAFFVAAWAAQRSGLRYTPIPTGSTAAEVSFILTDSGARVLLADQAAAALASELDPRRAITTNVLIGSSPMARADAPPGFRHVDDLLADASHLPASDHAEGAPLLYSSGSSGRPKGVEVPLPAGGWNSDVGLAARFASLYGMEPGDVFFCPAPLYHAAPLLYTMATHRVGATVVIADGFDAAGALATIERWGVTHSLWVPTMFRSDALAPGARTRAP